MREPLLRAPNRTEPRPTVQPTADPHRTVQLCDRGTVQAQVFRARMKAYLGQGKAFMVGDKWRVRAVVIPVDHSYRSQLEVKRKECHAKLDAAIDLFDGE